MAITELPPSDPTPSLLVLRDASPSAALVLTLCGIDPLSRDDGDNPEAAAGSAPALATWVEVPGQLRAVESPGQLAGAEPDVLHPIGAA